ncbi:MULTISPECIES: DNA-directed RNA polymerase subunit beta [Aerococcus]|uniref:DNA-directed RNA polymerase subunit beta n=1 Tax=Aerococcus sanguinicola TaxID=119206 RepID=A0A5N1GMZ2_9LACT|nr:MULTISPECIES: DNA-directed RNA polymerase subunit beta [Aerococcus]KAA9301764.1 DNA-directed RNA polymerase subunit beta [Aerococcus sanguinicola]MDK6368820.1 DNA-directed RNA polymerase subunit beta [Aerococcus sp. UMB9870]MDK6679419.1 DNA-directed RNA polymerase subunit beta [Aerococcus sp. UMB8608]MDK6685737.1 DNA-directed RNA polymerase subunit beta [Aerococcus sp. UMB8623]MDK6939444.1 DNA-directed RNA polymerase subunit beta [Aerococcus sp. UMB8487]
MTKHTRRLSKVQRWGLYLLALVCLFVIGLMLGYGIGSDHFFLKVFDAEVWQHLLDYFRT